MDRKSLSRWVAGGTAVALMTALLGYATVAGAQMGPVMGIVAGEGRAVVVASDQPDAKGAVVVDRVVSPEPAWVVVHEDMDGMPGKRVGIVKVAKGLSDDVRVELDRKPATPGLLVALHADRGRRGEFEFDMKKMEHSPDRPFFVGGKEVAMAFTAARFGVPAGMDEAMIEAGDQPAGATVTIAKAVAPEAAWVVVHEQKPDGMPGKRLGVAPIAAGESANVKVELDEPFEGAGRLIAAVHADRGESGEFEFDMDRLLDSPDQPYFVEGMEVAVPFKVGPFGVKADEGKAAVKAEDQVGAEGTLRVAEVKSPTDAWVVVHLDAGGGTPGKRVGLARVEAGTTRDLKVELEKGKLTEKVLVAVHADRGVEGRFDFDMMDKLGSPDQPFFTDGEEVATAVKVRTFGYATPKGTAGISAAPQPVANATVRVASVTSPEPAWVVVHLERDGKPGKRVGLARVAAGTTRDVVVQLDASVDFGEKLLAAVHADRGEPGVFEFDMMDGVNSPDQPYFVDGAEVATPIELR